MNQVKQYVKLVGRGWESVGMHNLICEVISSIPAFYTIEHNGKIYTSTASKTNGDPFYCELTDYQMVNSDTSELDALAEKLFIAYFSEPSFFPTKIVEHAELCYQMAQEFLDYKKRRNENGK